MAKIAAKDRKLFSLLKQLIIRIAGKNAEGIVIILFKKKNINEFKIAEKLGATINQTRNIIYRISSYNILNSIRKKDKRRGWYTYFWTLDSYKALLALDKIKRKELEILQKILRSRRTRQFYVCPTDNIEMGEETAMHHSFMCPECGKLVQPVPKDTKIREITNRIEASKRELNAIKEQLIIIAPKPRPPKKKKKKVRKRKKKLKKKKGKKKKGKKIKKKRKKKPKKKGKKKITKSKKVRKESKKKGKKKARKKKKVKKKAKKAKKKVKKKARKKKKGKKKGKRVKKRR